MNRPTTLEEAQKRIEELEHRLKHALDELVTLPKAAHVLDTSSARLRQLILAGRLDALRDRGRGGRVGYKVKIAEARRALENFA